MSWPNVSQLALALTPSDLPEPFLRPGVNNRETLLQKLIADTYSRGYDQICFPLTTDKWRKRWSDMCLLPTPASPETVGGEDDSNMRVAAGVNTKDADRDAERQAEAWRSKPGFLKDEVTMTRIAEAENVTIMIPDWLELDAADDWVRHDSETALQQELAYASYLGVQSAILPAPKNRDQVASYARTINACLKSTPDVALSVRLPIYEPSAIHVESVSRVGPSSRFSFSPDSSPTKAKFLAPPKLGDSKTKTGAFAKGDLNAMWEMWDVIRAICDYNPRLTLALDLTPPLPPALGMLKKWSAEFVRYIFIPASTFIANAKGYPVLPKDTQTFIRDCMMHRPIVILSDVQRELHNKGGEKAYSQYVRYLEESAPCVKAAQKEGTVENFAQGYQDYLQAPLQPLMHNLQSITYQTFEQDPVKYRAYEEAMYQALIEWPEQERIVFCIAGAGRGPLVARCLNAIERSRRNGFVYAVEKNPNAFVTLQERQELEWGDAVELLFGDMRKIDVVEKADILVSELLGSFGDNELSPECLDGAMRFLKPEGISIPSSYSAHLAPLSSSKLYNEVRQTRDEKSAETPYVVMFQAVHILSGPGPFGEKQIQECWEFVHHPTMLGERGLPLTNSHNARSAKLSFHIPQAGVLHGLAGYFEAVLYGSVGLSINPVNRDKVSKDMLSWFPLFFPFKEPLYLPGNCQLQVSIWRLTDERQVWYEWYAESFLHAPVGNRAATDGCINSLLASPVLPSAMTMTPGNSQSPSHSPMIPTASPMLDAVDVFSSQPYPNSPGLGLLPMKRTSLDVGSGPGTAMGWVKIGQSGLHNAGGRSSWIGL